MKLAAMAGSVYRAGVAAASEIKEQYNNTRVRGLDVPDSQISIPGSFPDVSIVTKGDEQMVLFPSYAKRHIRQTGQEGSSNASEAGPPTQTSVNDEDYWHQQWARMEDEKAVMDVDVRGWIYSPQKGPMTRRNRILVGLARRLSGIPPPTAQGQQTITSTHEEHERMREEQKIAREAREIERRGQGEKEVASRGGYSEPPKDSDDEVETGSTYNSKIRHNGKDSPPSIPSSPALAAKSWAQPAELTESELAVANANLMARLGPFMTTPLVEAPITLFFFNDKQSQSRTVMTNDAGHFIMRAALDFVPTHVRAMANESLSATEPVRIIESTGISLISDIDDTIKRSSIAMGAREIFRNTFIRDLGELTIDGVKEWYNSLHDMGVEVHYCSNSPWQLFPVLATYFRLAGLPPGSIHLKQYSGMLQGIFEPVAERKRGSVEKILRDFPERKFLLIGDSGEADLEVYTDLVVSNPNRILAVFIRDVTTPEQVGYFDATFSRSDSTRPNRIEPAQNKGDDPTDRPTLPPRIQTAPPKPEGPAMGMLIDFSEEPAEMAQHESQNLASLKDASKPKASTSASSLLARKAPPPRPTKPLSLRSSPSNVGLGSTASTDKGIPPPPSDARVRKPSWPQASSGTHPLSQIQNSSDQSLGNSNSSSTSRGVTILPPPGRSSSGSESAKQQQQQQQQQQQAPPPPPRRRPTQTTSHLTPNPPLRQNSRPQQLSRSNSNSDVEPTDALPDAAYQQSSSTTTTTQASAVNKKLDLWRRRLARAQETLDRQGVALYTWRKGSDVAAEAEGIVAEAMKKLGVGGGWGKR
jgi:phosphatidate phosphatase APP1